MSIERDGIGVEAAESIFTVPVSGLYLATLTFELESEDGYVNLLGTYEGRGLPLQPGNSPPLPGVYHFRDLEWRDEGEVVSVGVAIPNPSTPPDSTAEWNYSFSLQPVGLGPDFALE